MDEKESPTSPDPLSPMIGRRAGPWGMRTEKMALPFTNCNTRESGHGTFPGSTLELTVLVGVLISQAGGHESRRAAPTPPWYVMGWQV